MQSILCRHLRHSPCNVLRLCITTLHDTLHPCMRGASWSPRHAATALTDRMGIYKEDAGGSLAPFLPSSFRHGGFLVRQNLSMGVFCLQPSRIEIVVATTSLPSCWSEHIWDWFKYLLHKPHACFCAFLLVSGGGALSQGFGNSLIAGTPSSPGIDRLLLQGWLPLSLCGLGMLPGDAQWYAWYTT